MAVVFVLAMDLADVVAAAAAAAVILDLVFEIGIVLLMVDLVAANSVAFRIQPHRRILHLHGVAVALNREDGAVDAMDAEDVEGGTAVVVGAVGTWRILDDAVNVRTTMSPLPRLLLLPLTRTRRDRPWEDIDATTRTTLSMRDPSSPVPHAWDGVLDGACIRSFAALRRSKRRMHLVTAVLAVAVAVAVVVVVVAAVAAAQVEIADAPGCE